MQFSSKAARKALAVGLALSTVVWSVSLFAVPFAFAATHSNGCLVNANGTVWLIDNGMRKGFTSAEVFISHGYNFSQVVTANSDDTALPVGPIIIYANGTLVKGPSDPLVYLVVNGQKRGFTSGAVFTGLGYSFANIQWAPVNTFNDIPMGANINSTSETGLPMSGPGPKTVVCTEGNSNPGLSGGAGDLTLSSTSTDVEDTVKEGENNVNIFGVKAEADGSDIAITSVKVTFGLATGAGSENLEKYIDEVTINLGDTEVGSADVEDFTKDTGSPDTFTKTISLSGAVIDEDDDAKLYVAVSAISNIDSADDIDDTFDVAIETMRFTDATGAILSADVSDFDDLGDNDDFGFDDSTADDAIDLKSSTANPDDMNVQVDTDAKSDSTLALAFKLDVDEDSNDVDVTSMTFTVDIVDLDSDNDGDITAETVAGGSDLDLIDSVTVKIAGNSYDADLDDASVTIDADGDGSATFTADMDDLTIDAGDVEEGKVYVVFNDADNYNQDVVTAQVTIAATTDISAETSDDEVTVGGAAQDGAVLTPSLSGASVEVTDTSHSQNDAADLGQFTFEVTVTADGADVNVDAAAIVETILGPDATPFANDLTVVNLDGDATENAANDYTVVDGESNTFSISYALDPDTNGTYYIRLDSIDGVVVDETAGPETLVL